MKLGQGHTMCLQRRLVNVTRPDKRSHNMVHVVDMQRMYYLNTRQANVTVLHHSAILVSTIQIPFTSISQPFLEGENLQIKLDKSSLIFKNNPTFNLEFDFFGEHLMDARRHLWPPRQWFRTTILYVGSEWAIAHNCGFLWLRFSNHIKAVLPEFEFNGRVSTIGEFWIKVVHKWRHANRGNGV